MLKIWSHYTHSVNSSYCSFTSLICNKKMQSRNKSYGVESRLLAYSLAMWDALGLDFESSFGRRSSWLVLLWSSPHFSTLHAEIDVLIFNVRALSWSCTLSWFGWWKGGTMVDKKARSSSSSAAQRSTLQSWLITVCLLACQSVDNDSCSAVPLQNACSYQSVHSVMPENRMYTTINK